MALGMTEHDPLVHDLGALCDIDDWEEFLHSDPGEIQGRSKRSANTREQDDHVEMRGFS